MEILVGIVIRISDAPAVEVVIPNASHLATVGNELCISKLLADVDASIAAVECQLSHHHAGVRCQATRALADLTQLRSDLDNRLRQGYTWLRGTDWLWMVQANAHACRWCGGGNRPIAKFCRHCGTQLVSLVAQTAAFQLTSGSLSDQGRVRTNNEDTICTCNINLPGDTTAYLCLIADGMGGHNSGEQASQLAATVVRDYVQSAVCHRAQETAAAWRVLLEHALNEANQCVYAATQTNPAFDEMGTTLTVALFVGSSLHIAHVGDSRAYLQVPNQQLLEQLTEDQTLAWQMVKLGKIAPEQYRTSSFRNCLYQSIGQGGRIHIETRTEALVPGTKILLCSDGLVQHLSDEEIASILTTSDDPQRICEDLVAQANERQGDDNISAVLISVAAKPTAW